jgi:hypothetical protein
MVAAFGSSGSKLPISKRGEYLGDYFLRGATRCRVFDTRCLAS